MQSTATCSIAGCDKDARCRTLCGAHYVQLRKGTPVDEMRPLRVIKHRRQLPPFWELVDPWGPSLCWVWQGHISQEGYGVYRGGHAGASRLAHRIAYTLLIGEIPDGMVLDHLCKNRACANPDHLEVVTLAENSRRSPFRSRTHCKQGHEYAPENIYRDPKRPNKRACLTCRRERARAAYTRKRDAA